VRPSAAEPKYARFFAANGLERFQRDRRLLCGEDRLESSECGSAARDYRLPRATLAQLVEQLIRNQQVVGSNPTGGSKNSVKFEAFPLNENLNQKYRF
jgi:hypothetical protein